MARFTVIKNPVNVTNFNEMILKFYKYKGLSNEILNLIIQAYNISLALNPKRLSFKGERNNIKKLTQLYIELIKKNQRFLLDFLNFLQIQDNDLFKSLNLKYKSMFIENPAIEKEIERVDTLGSLLDTVDNDSFDSFNLDQDIKTEKPSDSDLNQSVNIFSPKTSDKKAGNAFKANNNTFIPLKKSPISSNHKIFTEFFNHIMIMKRFLIVEIINYEEATEILNFYLRTIKDKSGVILHLNIGTINNTLYDDELTEFIVDNSKLLKSNKFNTKKNMEELFNSYLNNIFYYDENLYNVFNLKSLIKIEFGKF